MRPITTMSAAPLCSVGLVDLGSGRRRGRLGGGRPFPEAGDRIGQLRTLVLPVLDTIEREAQRLFAFVGDRIVEADALDETAVAAIARVGDNDVEKRTLLGAPAGKSDDDHGVYLMKPKKGFY